jgi:hypothetical protein
VHRESSCCGLRLDLAPDREVIDHQARDLVGRNAPGQLIGLRKQISLEARARDAERDCRLGLARDAQELRCRAQPRRLDTCGHLFHAEPFRHHDAVGQHGAGGEAVEHFARPQVRREGVLARAQRPYPSSAAARRPWRADQTGGLEDLSHLASAAPRGISTTVSPPASDGGSNVR